MRGRYLFALAALVFLSSVTAATAKEFVLSSAEYPKIYATALDQPILDVVLERDGTVISDANGPVIFQAYIDTGSTSSVISYLQANGIDGVPNLGFQAADYYAGTYPEVGIGGVENGKVTHPFTMRVLNGQSSTGTPENLSTFGGGFGPQKLWVRTSEGPGERISLGGDITNLQDLIDLLGGEFGGLGDMISPINLVGMPVIRQRVMVMHMETSALSNPDEISPYLHTSLLAKGDVNIPRTNATLDLYLKDFTSPVPEGTPIPTQSENPMVRHITIANGTGAGMLSVANNEWLFDTGASGSFISFQKAKEVGLIPANYATLADFMATYTGTSNPIAGVGGGTIDVPVMSLGEIRIGTKENFDLVWQNVDVMVLDIAGLDGVFGMNLLGPAMTLDLNSILANPTDPLAFLQASPGYFSDIVFDATDPGNTELRLYSEVIPEPMSLTLLLLGGLAMLRRRKR